jgi:hypothetical protein
MQTAGLVLKVVIQLYAMPGSGRDGYFFFIFQCEGIVFKKIRNRYVRHVLNHTVFVAGHGCLKLQISGKPNDRIPTKLVHAGTFAYEPKLS